MPVLPCSNTILPTAHANGSTPPLMDTATGCAALASALVRRGPTARTEHVASLSVGKTLYWYRAMIRTLASMESGLPVATTVCVSSLVIATRTTFYVVRLCAKSIDKKGDPNKVINPNPTNQHRGFAANQQKLAPQKDQPKVLHVIDDGKKL